MRPEVCRIRAKHGAACPANVEGDGRARGGCRGCGGHLGGALGTLPSRQAPTVRFGEDGWERQRDRSSVWAPRIVRLHEGSSRVVCYARPLGTKTRRQGRGVPLSEGEGSRERWESFCSGAGGRLSTLAKPCHSVCGNSRNRPGCQMPLICPMLLVTQLMIGVASLEVDIRSRNR
jgi:hypothetical protein